MKTIIPKGLRLSKKKTIHPIFVWDCPECKKELNIHRTRKTKGTYYVFCSKCNEKFLLDKENVQEVITSEKSLIDLFYLKKMKTEDYTRILEKEIGWAAIVSGNEIISKTLDFKPTIEYSVCDNDGSSCYNPANVGTFFTHPESQKAECDRWLAEQKKDYPNGWVAKGSYETTREEWYTSFHRDWNDIVEAVNRIREKHPKMNVKFVPNINEVWKSLKLCCELLHDAKLIAEERAKRLEAIKNEKNCDTCTHNGGQYIYMSNCTGCGGNYEYRNYEPLLKDNE